MQAEPIVRWSESVTEFLGFVALFLRAGAVGFRYTALRGRLGPVPSGGAARMDPLPGVFARAERRAAVLGLIGTIGLLLLMVPQLTEGAARAHVSVAELVTRNASGMMSVGFPLLALIGFALAIGRIRAGWALAAIGVIVGWLRAALLGQWSRLINPVHSLAAGLWIGTLLVLAAAGLSALFAEPTVRDKRGAVAAEMVNAFSPLALTMGAVVVIFGVTTAWRHLHVLSNLWTTPYGWALIAKLCFVALVFALGAFNWRRQRPTLGSEEAAISIRRSSRWELTFAGVVLVLTAILVSIRPPRPPGAPGGPGGAGVPGGAAGGPPPAAAAPSGP